MHLRFCAGPANIELELVGYDAQTQDLANRFFSRFPAVDGRTTWEAALCAATEPVSHLGTFHLEMGPVSMGRQLHYPELPGRPLRHGAPRCILHGLMGLLAHFLRGQNGRLLHAAARNLPEHGAVVAIGPSGAGKSTLTSALKGVEMGDEGIALRRLNGVLCAQASLVPGERLPETWNSAPLAALLIPSHERTTRCVRIHGREAMVAIANAIIRLRGDDIFEDFDWAYDALKDVPVFRVGWSLDQSPINELKRALDATS